MTPEDLCELGVVKTATPCDQPWESMQGEGAVRFCNRCRLNVYDFSQLSSTEARELLIATEGRLCARIFTRADGTVLTRDCPAAIARQRRRRVGAVAAAATLLGGAAAAALVPSSADCPLDAEPGLSFATPPDGPQNLALRSGNEPGYAIAGGLRPLRPEELAALKKQRGPARPPLEPARREGPKAPRGR